MALVYSLVYSLYARCYSVSLRITSTASAIVMPAGCLVSSGTGRSRSKASNSAVLKSGIPASRAANRNWQVAQQSLQLSGVEVRNPSQ